MNSAVDNDPYGLLATQQPVQQQDVPAQANDNDPYGLLQAQQPPAQAISGAVNIAPNAAQQPNNKNQKDGQGFLSQFEAGRQAVQQWANSPTVFNTNGLPDKNSSLSAKILGLPDIAAEGVLSLGTDALKGTLGGLSEFANPETYSQTSGTEQGGQGPSFNALASLAGVSPAMQAAIPAKEALSSNNGISIFDSIFHKPDYATNEADQKTIANQIYQRASAENQGMPASDVNSFLEKANALAPQSEEGKAFSGTTPITDAISKFNKFQDKPISFQGAQEIDESLSGLIDKETDPISGPNKQAVKLGELQDQFRQAMSNGTLSDARMAWTQAMKMGDVERMMAKANGAANPSRVLQTQANNLRANRNKTGWWNDNELDALGNVADAGATTNTLRMTGSGLVPYVAAGVGTVVGHHLGMGSEIGAAMGTGAGFAVERASKNAATAIKMGQAQKLLNTIGRNSPRLKPEEIPPATPPQAQLPAPSINVPPDASTPPPPSFGSLNIPQGNQLPNQFYAPDSRALTYQPRPDFIATSGGMVSQVPNVQVGQYRLGSGENMPLSDGEIKLLQEFLKGKK